MIHIYISKNISYSLKNLKKIQFQTNTEISQVAAHIKLLRQHHY